MTLVQQITSQDPLNPKPVLAMVYDDGREITVFALAVEKAISVGPFHWTGPCFVIVSEDPKGRRDFEERSIASAGFWAWLGSMVAQSDFKLTSDARTREQRIAERAERLEDIELEEGRRVIEGIVVSWKHQESDSGTQRKMLVEEASGARIWGVVAAALDTPELRGRRVRFTAKATRSSQDKTSGFYSHPTKASFVEEVPGKKLTINRTIR